MGKNSTSLRIFLIGMVGVLLATPAFAYLDPNATGLITQILGPILVVAAAGLTFLRKQIGTVVQRIGGVLFSKK
jgi:hypothetical protein